MTNEWHRLTEVDRERKTGKCSVCGPTAVRIRAGGRGAECRTRRLQQLKRARTVPESRRKRFGYLIESRYGLSLEEFDALVLVQEGRCALCATPDPSLVVDHDHVTGRVRGLLCRFCNRAIALWGDQPEGAHRLVAYLSA